MASDHAGFGLKEELKGLLAAGGHDIVDVGYGSAMIANRILGVDAVVCQDPFCATLARSHSDSNVLCLGAKVIGAGIGWRRAAPSRSVTCGPWTGRRDRRPARFEP